jgi:hypothetical protein
MTIPVIPGIGIRVECADALTFKADVLVLKHAQALYGVDELAVEALEQGGVDVRARLPPPDGFRLIPSNGLLGADAVLFLGVGQLRSLDYQELRDFGCRALSSLAGRAPQVEHVALTLHGPGFGLDESEAFRAEFAGLLDAVQARDCPRSLRQITFVENSVGRAARLAQLLGSLSGGEGLVKATRSGSRTRAEVVLDAAMGAAAGFAVGAGDTGTGTLLRSLEGVGRRSKEKKHVFVAMPFASEFDDLFHYGIQGAVNAAGFLCERADLASFTGDVIAWVKDRIASADLVVADLSSANPNVYLEVGYAWGKEIPTVLIAKAGQELKFDVRGQRCLIYPNIRGLEEMLREELAALLA